MIDEIAAIGASHVALVVTWAQPDVRAIHIAPSKATIDDAIVDRAIARAHARGLDVLLFPILTIDRLRPGEWRGTVQPGDIDAWWLSYEQFIVHYATIAARHDTESLLVGSELGSTEAWRYRWYHLISRVERLYGGTLVYSANWDHYQQVSFWNRLDFIGVTGYFELSRSKNASQAELERAWRPIRDQLVAYAARQDRPLWITEIGYTSVDGAATRPWDYTMAGAIDLEEQRRLYAAFVRVWTGVSRLEGVFFWNWYGKGGPDDRDYTPKGKPAEAVLRRWWSPAASQDRKPATPGSRASERESPGPRSRKPSRKPAPPGWWNPARRWRAPGG